MESSKQMNIIWKGSPNFIKRTTPVKKIVIHWFGVGTLESANSRFQNPASQVSAHYGISKGRVWQWVKENDVAFHAGNLAVNKESIGIENDATLNGHDLSEQDYLLSAQLVRDICQRHNIPLDREHIIPHSQVKPTQCPGTINIDKIINLAKMTLKVKVLINGNWATINDKLKFVSDWYKNESGGKLLLDFDVEQTQFTNIPFQDYNANPSYFAWGVEKNWQIQNLLPKAVGYDIMLFHMNNVDWGNHPENQGVMLGDFGEQKTMVINNHADENEGLQSPIFGSQFAYLAAHEISHAMLGITGQDYYDGVNMTHKYFYTPDFVDAKKIFELLNYETLSRMLDIRRNNNEMELINDNGTIFITGNGKKIGLADEGLYNALQQLATVKNGSTASLPQIKVIENVDAFIIKNN